MSLESARALHRAGRLTEAAQAYLAVAGEDPTNPEAGLAIAQWYLAKGNTEMALALVDSLLRLLPREATLYALKGAILLRQNERDRAEAWLVRAVELNPMFAQGWGYLAQAASRRGRWDQAIALLKKALQIDANEVTSRYNLGLCYLRRGKWRRGWAYYEDRWQTIGHQASHQRSHPGRRWKGERIGPDDTIMVQAEQGQGDTFQFLRYLPKLAETGARIFFEYGRPEMRGLLERHRVELGIERLCHLGDLIAETDWHVPLLSLPWCLKLDAPINPGRYLIPRRPVRRSPGLPWRVGMVWAGSTEHTNDAMRSTTRDQWAPILAVPNVEFVDLQVGRDGTFCPASWEDTADALTGLDLLIAVDTGIVHLAGAMGIRTWALLAFQNDWRWGESGTKTPWYDSLTLYRQPSDGDWESVMRRVAHDLSTCVQATHDLLTQPPEECSV